MLAEDLLPCPFCGGNMPKLLQKPASALDHTNRYYYYIFCVLADEGCGLCSRDFIDRNEAINYWNTRPEPQAVTVGGIDKGRLMRLLSGAWTDAECDKYRKSLDWLKQQIECGKYDSEPPSVELGDGTLAKVGSKVVAPIYHGDASGTIIGIHGGNAWVSFEEDGGYTDLSYSASVLKACTELEPDSIEKVIEDIRLVADTTAIPPLAGELSAAVADLIAALNEINGSNEISYANYSRLHELAVAIDNEPQAVTLGDGSVAKVGDMVVDCDSGETAEVVRVNWLPYLTVEYLNDQKPGSKAIGKASGYFNAMHFKAYDGQRAHELKIEERYADDVLSGLKTLEVRNNDRDFKAGDRIRYQVVSYEGHPLPHDLNDKVYEITYVLKRLEWLAEGYAAMGIRASEAGVATTEPEVAEVAGITKQQARGFAMLLKQYCRQQGDTCEGCEFVVGDMFCAICAESWHGKVAAACVGCPLRWSSACGTERCPEVAHG